jgi:hypothetical protein
MMRNAACLVFALLALGTANAAAPAVTKAATAAAPAVPKPAAKTATASADEKKLLSEEDLRAEIANLENLDIKTGKLPAKHEAVTVATKAQDKVKTATKDSVDVAKLRKSIFGNAGFQQKVEAACAHSAESDCQARKQEALFCQLLRRAKPEAAKAACDKKVAPALVQISSHLRRKAPEDELAKEMTHDLEMNFNKIAPFGKEDTAKELQDHAAKTQDTLVDAVENAEVAEIKRAVFRALTRLRAATIKEFDTIARLETQAIDAYNDAHHYRAENPLAHLHEDEAPVETDKLKSFH